ncbi:hypothetical protein ELJ50_30515, partial [Klebsiella pneumoniae]|nr:hypothetical protein [Klebsiella pneumoniae]
MRGLAEDDYDWQEYSWAILISAETTYFANIEFVSKDDSPITLYTFDVLIAETEYAVVAYVDN